MGFLIRLLKWIIGKVADYWIEILITVGVASGLITVAGEGIKYLFKASLCLVTVPRYVFWPWLSMTIAGVLLFLWALLKRPSLTAQNSYRSDSDEGFLWRWDVSANPSNSTPYGRVHNLTRYCPECQSVRADVVPNILDPTQTLVTCQKCKRATSVTDLFHLEMRVKMEIERRAATKEWRSAKKRIRRSQKTSVSRCTQIDLDKTTDL